MSRSLLASCAFVGCLVPLAATACDGHPRLIFDKPATLEGVLSSGKGTHEAQGAFSYVYLTLDKPVCVDAPPAGAGDEDAVQSVETPVLRVQIAGEATSAELPLGKRVSIEGTLFAAHTMWHVEDVLIDATEVKPL
jgi:hypothetical protein